MCVCVCVCVCITWSVNVLFWWVQVFRTRLKEHTNLLTLRNIHWQLDQGLRGKYTQLLANVTHSEAEVVDKLVIQFLRKKENKCNVLSSMVTHTRNWSSAFNPSKCTHTAVSSEHTHCEHTPGAVGSHCFSARGAVGGSVPCSRAPQSWYWRRRECCSFTIPTFNPCRTWDSSPQPLDYKSDSLTIRPRLPPV